MNCAKAIAILLLIVAAAISRAEKTRPVRLIFDTDIMGDVDDVGTVATLHALATRGEVEILAIGVCVKNPWSPLCLDALNTYFGRPDIPLGVVKGPAHNRPSRYAQQIAEEFPHALEAADDAPDAAILYRQVLSKEADGSVVMVSVGQLTNFRNLLKTSPDAYPQPGNLITIRRCHEAHSSRIHGCRRSSQCCLRAPRGVRCGRKAFGQEEPPRHAEL